MARIPKATCPSCAGSIDAGSSFCGHCSRPTQWATHEQRIEWEVGQWRATRGAVQGALAAAVPSRSTQVAVLDPVPAAPVVEDPPAHQVPILVAPRTKRPTLLVKLRRLISRIHHLFDARLEASRAAAAEPLVALSLAPAPVATAPEPPVATPVVEPVENEAPSQVVPAAIGAPGSVKPKPQATVVRKPRPKGPTNKEMLQRTLTTLERVERRLHHLEQEVDAAVRSRPESAQDDDEDLTPPSSGFVGYI